MENYNLYAKNNIRNIVKNDLDKEIYMILKLEYLESMLKKSEITFPKTNSWDDVYENFFFKHEFLYDGAKVETKHHANNIFAQCWSVVKDSDAMWRIYSHDKKSVRIKTTIRKLQEAIYKDKYSMATSYIGAVIYENKEYIENWLKSYQSIRTFNLQEIIIESYFIKRDNFSHENEIRAVYHPSTGSPDINQPLKTFTIDIDDFLEEIAFDPRADDQFMEESRNMISKYDYPMERVIKSSLYDFDTIRLNIG